MGKLVEGKWTTQWYPADAKGRFQRTPTKFHDEVTADGSSGFRAESGRYHLYVSYACPWAHRTLIFRKLKGLEEAIDVTVVDPFMGDDGWAFSEERPECGADPIHGARFLRDVYVAARSDYTGRVTVPVLWDKERGTIVNNESLQLIRMLDSAFDAVAERPGVRLFPEARRDEVEAMIEANYEPVNNGVYRCGFASSQEAYDEAVTKLFARLYELEALLGERRHLLGDEVTAADWTLFTTLLRFDPVYVTHFKCNRSRVADLPNLLGYLRELYQRDGVAETCNLDHIREHYYRSHPFLNPQRIIPVGFEVDLNAAHGRG